MAKLINRLAPSLKIDINLMQIGSVATLHVLQALLMHYKSVLNSTFVYIIVQTQVKCSSDNDGCTICSHRDACAIVISLVSVHASLDSSKTMKKCTNC